MRTASLIAHLLSSIQLVAAIRYEEIEAPKLDLSSFANGELGFLGNFDATSRYSYLGESNFTNQNSQTNELIYKNKEDQFISLGQINGTVTEIVPIGSDSFLILGDYNYIGYDNVASPAIYNLTSDEFRGLDTNNELQGNVTTALYDNNLIYLGGDFNFQNSRSAAIYNLSSNSLSSPLFKGFGSNSHVNSIVKLDSSIIFGGQFDTVGYPQLLSSSYNSSNISVETDQLVSLRYASISSSNGQANLQDISCPSGNGWVADGEISATLNIGLPITVIPSKIRIYNSQDEDSQLSLFRLITAPTNGIMNLTYIDPLTGDLAVCDAWCPLLKSSDLVQLKVNTTVEERSQTYGDSSLTWDSTFQEFAFVNSLEVSDVTFLGLSSYGRNVGIGSLQIYQSLFATYANNTLNEPACEGIHEYSRAETEGDWVNTPGQQYLTLKTTDQTDFSTFGVTFFPNITYAGEYSILMYTPGCSVDGTCNDRGMVNVTLVDESTDEIIESSIIYQTNEEDKYDSLFYGHLNGSVRLELKPESHQSGDLTFVADRIGVTIHFIDEIVNKNGTVSINGIFEYSPSNFTNLNAANLTQTGLIGNSTINELGSKLSQNANVILSATNETLFVGGDFESQYGDNFLKLVLNDNSSAQAISADADSVNGGLNGAVSVLSPIENGIIVLGSFNNTNNETEIHSLGGLGESMSNAAMYNSSWYAVGDISSTTFANITFSGDEYWAFGPDRWDFSESQWFNDSLLFSFNVSSAGNNGNDTLFVGSVRKSETIGNKGTFVNSDLNQTNITSEALTSSEITTGVFVNESLSIFGGNFNISNNIQNLFIVQNNETKGLDISWNRYSEVTKLLAVEDNLFIGTTAGGSVNNIDFHNVLIYHLRNSSFASSQPDALKKSNSTPQVSEFGYLNDTYLVVGGDFDSAGSVNCSGLCFYNLNESSWESVIDNLSGTVNSFRFVNDTIVVAGDVQFEDDSLKLLSYNFNFSNQSQPESFQSVEREVGKFILVDNSTDGRIIISGADYISAYDGSNWTNIDEDLNNSTIRDIALLELEESNEDNNGTYFNSNQILLAAGNLTLLNYGYSNVAYFNGTNWIPYIIATRGQRTTTIDSIFLNKDISSLYRSGVFSDRTSPHPPSSTPSHTATPVSKQVNSEKMDRGFIVLVGLACAVGTTGLLGGAGALALLKRKKTDYEPVQPRVNETEMLDTVPPETLFKHV